LPTSTSARNPQGLGFRISLGHLGEKTLGRPKGGDGLQAVSWFGKVNGKTYPYCKEARRYLHAILFYHALEKGYLVYSDKSVFCRMLADPDPMEYRD